MSARKAVEPGCDGTVLCPVPGHVQSWSNGATQTSRHIPLTPGQRKTLREYRRPA